MTGIEALLDQEHSLDCLVANMRAEVQQKVLETDTGKTVVAIGGYSSLGKGVLAQRLAESIGKATVLPVDSFILDRATKRRLGLTGDEPDAIKFNELIEVLHTLLRGEPASIKPYDHSIGNFQKPIELAPQQFVIIEGSGSLYSPVIPFLDLSYFIYADQPTLYALAKEEYLSKRGYTESEFSGFWDSYRNNCELFITHSMKNAKSIINITSSRRYRSNIIRICNESPEII